MRGCVEEAVSSTFPHGIAFFVMQNVATRGDLQRQRASVETLLARDVDMELFVESVNLRLGRSVRVSFVACPSASVRPSLFFQEV